MAIDRRVTSLLAMTISLYVLRCAFYVKEKEIQRTRKTKKKIAGNNGYRSPRRFTPRYDKSVVRHTKRSKEKIHWVEMYVAATTCLQQVSQ